MLDFDVRPSGDQGLPPPYINDALFKCDEIMRLSIPPTVVPLGGFAPSPPIPWGQATIAKSSKFTGAILTSNRAFLGQKMIQEQFTFYGVHLFTVTKVSKKGKVYQEHFLSLLPEEDQYLASPSSQNRIKSLPDPFSQVPNFNVVFFHPDELTYLTTFHKNQKFVHVSRAIIDYGNGQQYQTLKLRPEPHPAAALIIKEEDQMGDVAYLIGNSCPPTWRDKNGNETWDLKTDRSYVTLVEHEGQTFQVSKTMINLLLKQKYVPLVQADPSKT